MNCLYRWLVENGLYLTKKTYMFLTMGGYLTCLCYFPLARTLWKAEVFKCTKYYPSMMHNKFKVKIWFHTADQKCNSSTIALNAYSSMMHNKFKVKIWFDTADQKCNSKKKLSPWAVLSKNLLKTTQPLVSILINSTLNQVHAADQYKCHKNSHLGGYKCDLRNHSQQSFKTVYFFNSNKFFTHKRFRISINLFLLFLSISCFFYFSYIWRRI